MDLLRSAAKTYTEERLPAERLRKEAAVLETIDRAGRISDHAAAPFRTPLVLQWGSGDTRYKAVARPGRATMIAARCDTAPSGGPCVVTLQWESAITGLTTLGSVTIEAGQRFSREPVPVEVATLPAGAWVRALSPSPANGATGVDVELTLELGATS